MPKVRTAGAELEVADTGASSGDAPALVFLHYWGGSADTWRKVVARLEEEARCVALDQRGWGGSRATDGRYDLEAMADDVLEVAGQLGLQSMILVGHSMGGKVAQIAAMRRPEALAGLALVAPAPPTPMPVPEAVREGMLASYQSETGVAQALEVLAGPSLPPEDRPLIVRDTLAGASGAKREWTERGMVADLGMAPGDVEAPVGIVVGALDRVEAPDGLRTIFARYIPQAQLRELPGVGHLAPLEAPDAIAEACREVARRAAKAA